MQTLPITLAVRVALGQQVQALALTPFGRGLIVGSSTNTRPGAAVTGIYTSITAVGEHYGSTTPEYEAAARYFAQVPRPRDLMIATVGK